MLVLFQHLVVNIDAETKDVDNCPEYDVKTALYINPSNLLGNVIIIHLLIDIVCTNVEVTSVNNDIRVILLLLLVLQ